MFSKLPLAGLWSLHAVGCHILGLLLAEQRGRVRPDLPRYHHCPHHDLHGTGGQERSPKGHLSNRPGLLRFYLIYVHFLHCRSGMRVRN